MRVIVCGGRAFADGTHLWRALDDLHATNPITCVIHGSATGADFLAGRWAYDRRIPIEVFAADWMRDGRTAGPKRNQRMLTEGRPEMVVAFPGGRGTADMVRRANRAGLPVVTP